MSHTPGPWTIGPADWMISQRHGMGYRNFPVRAPGGYDVATVYCDEDDAEQDANVNLIAAAPDLLDAVEELLIYLADWDDPDNETCQRARAAVAKAKGERL